MKLAIVVQRYGADINGGAELHARYIAERLCRARRGPRADDLRARLPHVAQRVSAGAEEVNGIPVERFPRGTRARPHSSTSACARRACSRSATRCRTSSTGWTARGRSARDLLDALRTAPRTSSTSCSFSACATTRRTTARGPSPGRAVLVPTAEREPALGLALFQPVFRGVRAIMYNSFEERAAIHARRGQRARARRRRRRRLRDSRAALTADARPAEVRPARPFIVYVGRIDANKGAPSCSTLLRVPRMRYLTLQDR